MRNVLAFLLITAVASFPAHAHRVKHHAHPAKVIKFAGLQENCVQTDKVKFGADAKWSGCKVTRGRWVATLDFLDLYQTQYCLARGENECDQRALLIFANRAYTPNAKVLLQRFDPSGTTYDDPVVIQTKYGDMMTVAANLPDGSVDKSYYRWNKDHWIAVNARKWLRDLSRQLPKGDTIEAQVWPDVDSMSAHATLIKASGAGGKTGVAAVELAIAKGRFVVKKVKLAPDAD